MKNAGVLDINGPYGNCPVQIDGTILIDEEDYVKDIIPFYFRARGNSWSLGIGKDPIGNTDWFYKELYGEGEEYYTRGIRLNIKEYSTP